jgi:hypothetical protein
MSSVIEAGLTALLVSVAKMEFLCPEANHGQGIKRQSECKYATVANILERVPPGIPIHIEY